MSTELPTSNILETEINVAAKRSLTKFVKWIRDKAFISAIGQRNA